MRRLVLSLVIIGTSPFWAARTLRGGTVDAPPPQREYRELTAGRYSVKVTGMLCHACARAIVNELGKLKEIGSVKADFEAEQVVLEIPLDRALPIPLLRKALKRAAKKINLETRFEAAGILYLP